VEDAAVRVLSVCLFLAGFQSWQGFGLGGVWFWLVFSWFDWGVCLFAAVVGVRWRRSGGVCGVVGLVPVVALVWASVGKGGERGVAGFWLASGVRVSSGGGRWAGCCCWS